MVSFRFHKRQGTIAGTVGFALLLVGLLAATTLLLTKLDQAFAVGSDGVWVQVRNMLNSHCLGGTILLDNGKVLVTTGYDGSAITPASELFDPLSKTWTATGNVNQARHSWRIPIVKLNDGRAMLVGGADQNVTSLASVELYDPSSGAWSYTSSLNTPRRQPAVIKLQNGKVLVAAGANGVPDGNRFLRSSEIYDTATGQWTYSGNMHVAREVGNVVMLQDGRVMVAGGEGPWFTPGKTAEIYDPNTGQWTLTAPMLHGWFGAAMTVLKDGRVLVAGGWDGTTEASKTAAMIYDPAANTWTYTGSMYYQHSGNAALLSDGTVLTMGGDNSKSAELYDPLTGRWTLIGDLHQVFNTPNGVVTLPNGDIFAAGGCTGTAEIFTTQIFSISGNVWVDTDRNGSIDSGENSYQGGTITLSGAARATATTDGSGNYSFTGLLAGNYTVTLTEPEGYTATTANPVSVVLETSQTVDFGIAPAPSANIFIRDVKVNQAVDAMDINQPPDAVVDLVAERPTVIRVEVSVTGNLSPAQEVEIQVSSEGNRIPLQAPTQTRTVASLLNNPVVDFLGTTSAIGIADPGLTGVIVTIDPAHKVLLDRKNSQREFTVNIKSVRDVRYAYFQVDYLVPTGNLDMFRENFSTTVQNSVDYLKAVFPVSPGHFFHNQQEEPIRPFDAGREPTKRGAAWDALALWLEAKLLTGFQAERVIAIVPQQWFTHHQLGDPAGAVLEPDAGSWFPMVREVAFVLNDRPLATAHELHHTYGLGEVGYNENLDGSCCNYYGAPTRGYWVERSVEVTSITAGMEVIDYMGAFQSNIPYPAVGEQPAVSAWTTGGTDGRFADLFRQFRQNQNDPEVLLVTGTIHQDGTVTLGTLYRALEGTLSEPQTGDAAIRVVDATGHVLAEVPFTVDFRVFGLGAPTLLNAAPFAFAIPYPPAAAQVQIVRAGQIIAQVHVTTTLLRDAVASIPDVGFTKNPEQRRNALLYKINELDNQLAVGNLTGAENKLRYDIRERLADWLLDEYATQSRRQYTKLEILELVDELLQRLRG